LIVSDKPNSNELIKYLIKNRVDLIITINQNNQKTLENSLNKTNFISYEEKTVIEPNDNLNVKNLVTRKYVDLKIDVKYNYFITCLSIYRYISYIICI
jgi:hypothetical protein